MASEETLQNSAVPRQKMTWRHVMVVVTAAAMGFVGTSLFLNCSGIFYNLVAEEFNVGLGQVTLYYSLSLWVTIILLPIAGRLLSNDKYPVRVIYAVANIALAAAFFINASAQNVYMMYIAGVLAAGMCTFDMYMMPVIVRRWFDERSGFFVGLAGACSGIGGALWNIVGANVIASGGWRMGYLFFGVLVLVILVPMCIIFLRNHPEDVGLKKFGAALDGSVAKKESMIVTGADYAAVMKSAAFPLIIVMGICGGLVAMIAQYMTAFAVSIGYEAIIGASMTSAAMIGNMLTKVVFGGIADKSPFASVLCGVLFPVVALIGLFLVGGGNPMLVIAIAFIFGGSQPNNVIILPVITEKLFGEKDYAKIWGAISPFCALASGFGATIWGWIYDGMGTFEAVFIVAIVLLLIRLVAFIIAKPVAEKIPHTEAVVEQ